MRTILCSSLFAVVLASPAFATESRNAALNADGWKVKDDTNVDLLPAEMMNYKKTVWGELGTTSAATDDYAGAHIPVGPGLLGIWAGALPDVSAVDLINRADDASVATINVPSFSAGGAPFFASTAPNPRFRIMYGLSLGGNLDVAAGVDYFSQLSNDDSFTDGIGTTTFMDSSSVINIRAGLSVPLGFIDPLSVGLIVGLPSFTVENQVLNAPVNSFNSTGGTDLAINLRARLAELVGAASASYVFLSYGTGSLEAESVSAGLEQDKEKVENGHITVGISNNHRVGEGSVVIWAIAYQSNMEGLSLADTVTPVTTASQETTMSSLPITVAFETKPLKWLSVRLSSWSAIVATTTTETKVTSGVPGFLPPVDTTKADQASYQSFALGVTLALSDKLALDAVLKEDFLFDGPYFIGGAGTGLFSRVSLEYRF